MELGSIIGLIAGAIFIFLSILFAAEMDIGGVLNFLDAPSFMIVFGGTLSAALISNPLDRFTAGLKVFGKIMKQPNIDTVSGIRKIIDLANLARKEGLLALEEAVVDIEDDFLKKGIMLIVDGTDPELVRSILETELSYLESRHKNLQDFWGLIGSLAPAWGMIGTLIGLVMMLQALDDPTTIGPKMAVALITTFYGSVIANYIAEPVRTKLSIFSADEMLVKEILIEGMLSIQAGENPRIIEEKLKSFLPPTLRNSIGEEDGGDE